MEHTNGKDSKPPRRGSRRWAASPTDLEPGTDEKLALLRRRADFGLPLHVAGDRMSAYAAESFAAMNGLLGGLWHE